MPRRIILPTNGEFYHIVKRGIEERKIFLDKEDRLRFINSLLVFNDKKPTPWDSRSFWYNKSPDFLTKTNYQPKDPLVEIHVFSLMPNHFHLLVRQLIEKGIQIFMQKLGGYSKYFNQRYEREGTLFQNRYKIIHVETERQLKNGFVYIHTNPTALVEPGWKEWQVKNPLRAIRFLEKEYQWSSLWDFLGKENFPQVTSREFFLALLGGAEGVRKEVNSWIELKNEIFKNAERLSEVIFE